MVTTRAMLCNQGCHTHIYLKNGAPYNVLDNEPHKCPMLEIAKLWGGRYNTIPMNIIKNRIKQVFDNSRFAANSRNIDDILKALRTTVDNLQYVMFKMEEQEEQNTVWSNNLDAYKKQLVKDQNRREEEKLKKPTKFITGDKL
jgi:hypothetical protein